jgi:hypothetical protein
MSSAGFATSISLVSYVIHVMGKVKEGKGCVPAGWCDRPCSLCPCLDDRPDRPCSDALAVQSTHPFHSDSLPHSEYSAMIVTYIRQRNKCPRSVAHERIVEQNEYKAENGVDIREVEHGSLIKRWACGETESWEVLWLRFSPRANPLASPGPPGRSRKP